MNKFINHNIYPPMSFYNNGIEKYMYRHYCEGDTISIDGIPGILFRTNYGPAVRPVVPVAQILKKFVEKYKNRHLDIVYDDLCFAIRIFEQNQLEGNRVVLIEKNYFKQGRVKC